MKAIGFTGIVKWYLFGFAAALIVGAATQALLSLSGAMILEESFLSAMAGSIAAMAATLLQSMPLAILALVLWTKAAATYRRMEQGTAARFCGLAVLSVVVAVAMDFILTMTISPPPGEGYAYLWHAFTGIWVEKVMFSILVGSAILLPRVVLRSLRGPVMM